ncbi:MAG TPA: S8 family serine peptidase [Phycisphaerales bacterium]|nr:S8 family serine peptidase [Phycisphaerales bacterium]
MSIAQTVADAILSFQWMVNPDGNPGTSFDVPHVCSNSWGVTTGHGYPNCDQTFWSFIDNSEAAGTIQLFSAGNEGPGATTLRRPADRATDEYRSMAVASVSPHDSNWPIASSSSRGPTFCTQSGQAAIKPDIAAPGVTIRSALGNGSYGNLSGTSMASPHVNGVMALMLEACPILTHEDVKQIIYDTAFDLGTPGKDNAYGWGMVDAVEAVLMAQSMCGIGITLPNGAPTLIDPGVATSFTVRVVEGQEQLVPGSAKLFYRYDGGAFNTAQLVHAGGEFYTATLPPAQCSSTPEFYVQVEGDGGSVRTHPAGAPSVLHSAIVGDFVTVEFYHEDFASGQPAGWTTTGLWNFTTACAVSNPCDDNQWAYYGQVGSCNYETGGTNSGEMVSAPISIPAVPAGGTVMLTFCYTLQTESSTSYDRARFNIVGQPQTQLSSSPNAWTTAQFNVTAHAGSTVQLRWHFDTVDGILNNFRGWQVDNLRISMTDFECEDVTPACAGDLDNSGAVDVQDLLILLGAWGPCNGCAADLDNSGSVDVQDLLILLGAWGPCP